MQLENQAPTGIRGQFSKIAVNRFDSFCFHNGIQSVEGVANPPQIRTWLWHSDDCHLSRTFKFSQRVDPGRSRKQNATKVEASDWQNCFICYDSFRKDYSIEYNELRQLILLQFYPPKSDSCVCRDESQLHGRNFSKQFPSIPHWQMGCRWMLELFPDQKYRAIPFLSFHQENGIPLKFNGALTQSY